MVLRGFAWFCVVLHGFAWFRVVWRDFAWFCVVLHGFKFRRFLNVPNRCSECLGILGHAFAMFKFVICLYSSFLVTFEAIFCSNNNLNFTKIS